MGKYLNSRVPFESYREIAGTRFFVDKSLLLEDILNTVEVDGQKYLCITGPRRFGKSVMANMVALFFERAVDSGTLFERLAIARSENYKTHLNKHNVVYIDFSETPRDRANYRQYIARIQDGINHDLAKAYHDLSIDTVKALWDILDEISGKQRKNLFLLLTNGTQYSTCHLSQEQIRLTVLIFSRICSGIRNM